MVLNISEPMRKNTVDHEYNLIVSIYFEREGRGNFHGCFRKVND